MLMKIFHLFISVVISCLGVSSTISPSLLEGTLVHTKRGAIRVERLRHDDELFGCKEDGTPIYVKIVRRRQTCEREIVIIETPLGKVRAAPSQMFYDVRSKKWVSAADITTQAALLTDGYVECPLLESHP